MDNSNGTYSVAFQPRKRGMYEVHIQLNDVPIRNSPFSVVFKSAKQSDPKKCLATGVGLLSPTLGVKSQFFIEAKDAFDNPSDSELDKFNVEIKGPSTTSMLCTCVYAPH